MHSTKHMTLYHKAVELSKQPQVAKRYTQPDELLLTAPSNVIFELFGTIAREIPSESLVDYVGSNFEEFLIVNWESKFIQRIIFRLRREQFIDSKSGLRDLPLIRSISSVSHHTGKVNPVISEQQPSSDALTIKQVISREVRDQLLWRIKTNNITQLTSLTLKLVIEDGYKRSKLKLQLFDEVTSCFEDWRSNKLIKLYAFGNGPAEEQKLILSSTNKGSLGEWIANYIDGSEKRQDPDLIRKLSSALRDTTKNCIFISHDSQDALKALQTDSLRCAILVDRYGNLDPKSSSLYDLVVKGKLYIVSSLNCIKFAPDPTIATCC